jgi:hypothetical protein
MALVVEVRQLETKMLVAERVRQREIQKLVAERQHGGAGGESRWEDESVVPELDAPLHCGGNPRGDLESELVDAKTVIH